MLLRGVRVRTAEVAMTFPGEAFVPFFVAQAKVVWARACHMRSRANLLLTHSGTVPAGWQPRVTLDSQGELLCKGLCTNKRVKVSMVHGACLSKRSSKAACKANNICAICFDS